MRVTVCSVVFVVSVALINMSWAGLQEKQDKKEKVHDVGKALNLTGNLDNSLNSTYSLPQPKFGSPDKKAHQVFAVNLVKDKTYLIEYAPVEGAGLNPYLVVEDAKKKVLADYLGFTKASLYYKAPENGVYRIVATTIGGRGEGDFTVKVAEAKEEKKVAEKPRDIGKGLELKGNLDNNLNAVYDAPNAQEGSKFKFSHQVFPVNLVKGKTYRIEMIPAEGAELNPYVFIEDAKMKVHMEVKFGEDNQVQLDFRAPEDGVYRIVATTAGGLGEGDFTVKITEKK